jgi:hypothetical protein
LSPFLTYYGEIETISTNYIPNPGYYLLANSLFEQNSILNGFEFNATKNGLIEIKVILNEILIKDI